VAISDAVVTAYLDAGGPDPVPLDGHRLVIGRDRSCDIVVRDRATSRRHALLERLAAGWCLTDLQSRNGTWVNGERLDRERPLYDEDEIRVGRTLMVYRVERPRPSPDEPAL
jgi:pSer/pThr/pTyr-binding forkhead associated (FHA) protein